MMSTSSVMRFGIEFVDKHVEGLIENGIYLLKEEGTYARSSFIYHLLQTNLLLSNSCLYITNLSKVRESDIIKKNMSHLVRFNTLTILEVPIYVSDYIHGTAELSECIEDLRIYINNTRPSLIILQNIELLLNEGKETINKTLLSLFLSFLHSLEQTIIIDISNFDIQDINICEKYHSGIFDLQLSDTYQNYQLIFRRFKRLKNNSSLVFSLDSLNRIIAPIFRISSSIILHECKQVVMQKVFEEYEYLFLEIFANKVEFLYFETMNDLNALKINDRAALFIVSAIDDHLNGWDLTKWLRTTYPLNKILFAGSKYLPTYQKVRSRRFGADRFLPRPIVPEDLRRILVEMYQQEDDEQSRQLYHKVLFVSDEFIKVNKPATIYKNALFRYIKDFAFQMVIEGKAIHFYKFHTPETSVYDLIDTLKSFPNVCFISSFYIENNHLLFLVFKSLNDAETNNVKEYLTRFTLTEPKQYAEKNTQTTSDTEPWKLLRYAFPLDNTNIDAVLGWIYDEY